VAAVRLDRVVRRDVVLVTTRDTKATRAKRAISGLSATLCPVRLVLASSARRSQWRYDVAQQSPRPDIRSGGPFLHCRAIVFTRPLPDEADAAPESQGNPCGLTFELTSSCSIVERRGQRREPAAPDVRLLSGPLGWLPFAGPVGWPLLNGWLSSTCSVRLISWFTQPGCHLAQGVERPLLISLSRHVL